MVYIMLSNKVYSPRFWSQKMWARAVWVENKKPNVLLQSTGTNTKLCEGPQINITKQ
jgi:hypothetical protein